MHLPYTAAILASTTTTLGPHRPGRRHPVLRRQTEDLDRHWRFGTLWSWPYRLARSCHRSLFARLNISGQPLGLKIADFYLNTSLTVTLPDSATPSLGQYSTTRTNEQHHSGSTAHAYTSSVCLLYFLIQQSFVGFQPPPQTPSTRPLKRFAQGLWRLTHGLWEQEATYPMPTSYRNERRSYSLSSQRDAQSSASSHFLSALCSTASPSCCTSSSLLHFHTTSLAVMFDLIKQLHSLDIDTMDAPPVYQDLAGFFTSIGTQRFLHTCHLILFCSIWPPRWAPGPRCHPLCQTLPATPSATLSKDVPVALRMWPEKSTFATSNPSFWCPCRWPNFPHRNQLTDEQKMSSAVDVEHVLGVRRPITRAERVDERRLSTRAPRVAKDMPQLIGVTNRCEGHKWFHCQWRWQWLDIAEWSYDEELVDIDAGIIGHWHVKSHGNHWW